MRLFSLASLPVFLLAVHHAYAGVVFEVETRDFLYGTPRTEMSTIYADRLSLKMETRQPVDGDADSMIYRGDRREMIAVDHQSRSFMVIDKQFATNMMGQLQQVSGQMQGMLDSIPPDQRALVDQMMKNGPPQGQLPKRAPIEVQNTGKRAQVYGYPCVLYRVTRGGRKERDVWVTNWNNIKGSRELGAIFDSMSEFTLELMSAIPMQAQAQSPMQDNAFMTIKQMGGFPVATREYSIDGQIESETALRSAKWQSINPAVFEPPAGYQAEAMFGPSLGRPSGRTSSNFGQYGQGRR